ncbi:MAG: SET domain-containing protein-lysine N-methyltransferase [Dinghuibacter sp.]|nr:SET domain-containing protein-lysine N-methyltransferase [Dinghuibacter sp.]
MKVCVLLPDYSTTTVDYQYYDPPRDHLGELLPGAEVHTVFLNKLTTYRQLKQLSAKGYDIFVNLCEGYLDWEVPSIDVIYFLELLQLPFTGPVSRLYDPPKSLMKYVAFCEGVNTPAYVVATKLGDISPVPPNLKFPLFVKPAHAGDSLGVDEHSLVHTPAELSDKVGALLNEYAEVLVEEYIGGREFTVLVAANASPENTSTVYKPVEYIFPPGFAFKTYALKTRELHPDANVPCTDPVLDEQLRKAAAAIFKSFNGKGYARLDFRVTPNGEIYFLEINFTCSVFYKNGYEGSADFILQFDGAGQAGFLNHIIAEGIARHQRVKKKYYMKGDSIAGYGIYAVTNIKCNDLIFKGEERSQRLVTRSWVEQHWNDVEKENFRRYAYAISKEVFLLWDDEPEGWAPQNHSCMPNTGYNGLNVIALRDIQQDEELTLDYSSFLDEHMQPFHCQCGTPNCRKWISGTPGNTVSFREAQKG